MPLFEIETDSHIFITWAKDEPAAREVAAGDGAEQVARHKHGDGNQRGHGAG